MSPRGRRTNNRHKRKRLPPDFDGSPRGNQAGGIGAGDGRAHLMLAVLYGRALKVQARRRGQPLPTTPLPTLEERKRGIDAETETFLDKIRNRFRRKAR